MKFLYSKKNVVLLLLIVFIQCIVCVWAFNKKEGLFIDELWTFNLANSYFFPLLGDAKEYFGVWLSSDFFHSLLTVDPSHGFAYDSVWFNQATDVHPPLYYVVIHTICSLFPNVWSGWFGLVPNLLFFIGTQVVLFQISKEISKGNILFAIFVCVIYGFSIGAINTVITLRMYMMLTFFTVLAMWLNVLFIRDALTDKPIPFFVFLGLYIVYFCGGLTQYLFVIPLFFISLQILLLLVLRKKAKLLLSYTLFTVAGILTIFLVFPAAWEHIFGGGYRGNEAFYLIKNSEFFPRVVYFWGLMSNSIPIIFFCSMTLLLLFWRLLKVYVGFSLIFSGEMLTVRILKKKRLHPPVYNINFSISDLCGMVICFGSIFSFLVVSRITSIQDDRYLMFLFPGACLSVLWLFVRIAQSLHIDAKNICILLVLPFFCFSALHIHVSNIKWNNSEYKALNRLLQSPNSPHRAVYVDSDARWWPAMEQIKFFIQEDKTLMVTDRDLKQIVVPNEERQILLIISRFTNPEIVQNYLSRIYPSSTYEHISNNWHGQVFVWRR